MPGRPSPKALALAPATAAISHGGNKYLYLYAFTSNDGTADIKFMPLNKGGDANMVYYSGYYSQKVLPSAKRKFKGGLDTGSYLMIASKDSKNEWKLSYFHFSQAPLQENK